MTRNEILEKNIGLVYAAARHWCRRYPSATSVLGGKNDVIQLAAIAALHAIEDHDRTRGCLSTWIMNRIFWALHRHTSNAGFIRIPANHRGEARRAIGARMAVAQLSAIPASAGPRVADSSSAVDRLDEESWQRKLLEAALAKLPARWATVVRRRQAGETFGNIGRDLGISCSRVQQIYARALQALGKLLEPHKEALVG